MACSMLSQTSMYVAKPDDTLMAAASEIQLPFHRPLRPRYASGRHQRVPRAVKNAKIEIFEDNIGIDEILDCGRREQSDIGATFAKTESKTTRKVTSLAATRTSQGIGSLTAQHSTDRARSVKQTSGIESRASTRDNISNPKQHSTTTRHYNLYPLSRSSQLISTTTKPLQEIYKPSNNVLAQDWFGLDTGKENVPPGLHSPRLSRKRMFGQEDSPKQSRSTSLISTLSVPVIPVARSLQCTAVPLEKITTSPVSKTEANNEIEVGSTVGKVGTSSNLTVYQRPLVGKLESVRPISVQNWLLTEEQVVARLACHDLFIQKHRSYRLNYLKSVAERLKIVSDESSKQVQCPHNVVLRFAEPVRCLLATTESIREDHKHDHSTLLNHYCLELLMVMTGTVSSSCLAITSVENGSGIYTN